MTEEKTDTIGSRPFQLRPSILSSGFGSAPAPNEKKGFVLRPSALTSAADQLETLSKQEAKKRPLEENDSQETLKEESKRSKTIDDASQNAEKPALANDIEKPKGIGTFGFTSKKTNSSDDSNSDDQLQSKTNYFQQGLNNTKKSEKLTFGFAATAKPTFSSINKSSPDDASENNVSTDEQKTDDVTSKDKLLENAEEYQKSHNQRQHFEEVEQFTGEEGEQHVFQVICKLFLFAKEDKRWLEKGRGMLKLNDICQSEGVFQSRLVFRTQGTNLVLLNTKLWAEMCCEKVKEKSIRITALDPETKEVKVYLITTNLKDSLQTFTSIDRRIEALKRNRENISKSADASSCSESKSPSDTDKTNDDDSNDENSLSNPGSPLDENQS